MCVPVVSSDNPRMCSKQCKYYDSVRDCTRYIMASQPWQGDIIWRSSQCIEAYGKSHYDLLRAEIEELRTALMMNKEK